MVEGGDGHVRVRLATGQLVQQRAEADVIEPDAELIEPRQLPCRVLVRGQGREQRLGLVRNPDVGAQRGELPLALRAETLQLAETDCACLRSARRSRRPSPAPSPVAWASSSGRAA